MQLKNKYISKNTKTRLYNTDRPIIGLTGGIATGKSTVSALFESIGLKVICADKLVKEVYKQESIINSIEKDFPNAVNDKNIDFKKLRELAFNDPSSKNKIEQLIYKELPSQFKKSAAKIAGQKLIIYDVPLLFEKKLNEAVDFNICVYTNKETQLDRIIKRDNISKDLAEKIIDAQISIEEKKNKSDFIIDNSHDQQVTKDNFDKIISEIFETI
jgi:dephospho-CoA kinase